MEHPTFADGKICYIEIPAVDIAQSAAFYETVFNWKVRKNNHGDVAFDEAAGEVSGVWVTGRKPFDGEGLRMHLMVFDMAKTIEAVAANGGKIISQPDMGSKEVTATFSDPAGNIFGLYQHKIQK